MCGRLTGLIPAPSSCTVIAPHLVRTLMSPPRLECCMALLSRTISTSWSHSGSARTQPTLTVCEEPDPPALSERLHQLAHLLPRFPQIYYIQVGLPPVPTYPV